MSTLERAQAELVTTLTIAQLTERPLQHGPSLLELELADRPPSWWHWRRRQERRRRRERLLAQEYGAGLISFTTYRRLTPWLWEAPDRDAVW